MFRFLSDAGVHALDFTDADVEGMMQAAVAGARARLQGSSSSTLVIEIHAQI